MGLDRNLVSIFTPLKTLSKPVNLNSSQSEELMRVLLERARRIGSQGEVPVTAMILDQNGLCIGNGENTRDREKDPLGHAEIKALQEATKINKDWRFNDCTMIVTLEPCPMCAGAIIQARMGQLIYAATDLKRGGFGGAVDLSTDKSSHHKIIIERGILADEASKLLTDWFKSRRNNDFCY